MKTIHRILTPILTVLIFPAVIFLPLFRIYIASGLSMGETKANLLDNFGLSEFISLKDIYSVYKNGSADSMGLFKGIWDAFATDKKEEIIDMLPGLHWAVVALVFLVIVLLIALALIIVAAAVKKPAVSILLSGAGLVSALIMNAAFDAFAKPFLNGAFNLNTILGNTNQLLGALLGNVATFQYMKLGVAYSAILLIFLCTAILGICAYMEQKNEG